MSNKTERIGVIGAMEIEIEGLRAQMEEVREETVSGVRFTSGTLCGREVVLCVCGIGKVFAAIAAEAMILHFGVTALINTGVAGGLADGLRVGDVVVADAVVQHDMNTTACGDPQGLLSGLNLVELPADRALSEALFAAAKEENCHVMRGVIASGDLFVAKDSHKKFIKETFHAAACEMEGAPIGHVATVNGVPFAVLRCISDGGDGMEFEQFAKLAADISTRVILRCLRRLRWGHLRGG